MRCWTGRKHRLREAEEQAAKARQRWEFARIGRQELMDELASAGAQATWVDSDGEAATDGPPETGGETAGTARTGRERSDERPLQWHEGLGRQVLCGMYRQVFETVMAAGGLVDVATVSDTLGLGRERLAVERVRHRAYALHAKAGWSGRRACSGGCGSGWRPGRRSGQCRRSPAIGRVSVIRPAHQSICS